MLKERKRKKKEETKEKLTDDATYPPCLLSLLM